MAENITTKFRKLIKDPKLLLIPGGFSPLGARMAEEVGFKAFFLAASCGRFRRRDREAVP